MIDRILFCGQDEIPHNIRNETQFIEEEGRSSVVKIPEIRWMRG